MPSRTVISDVTKNEDGKNILNNPDKIVRWIKYQFEEQEIIYSKEDIHLRPFLYFIDLSNCVINTVNHDGKPIMTNLCDILNEIYKEELPGCFLINGYGTENRIYHEVLVGIKCENSIIYSAYFHQTRFREDVNFEGTEFKNHASFGSCIFEKYANFNETNVTGNSGFEGCTFNGKAKFNNAKFDCYQVHFEYSVFNGEFQANGMKFINDDKTARVLKEAALKSGNSIDALEYRRKEMQLFKKEVNKSNRRSTKLLLSLNGLSNNHGTDWIKGIIFTSICWAGSYLLFLITSRLGDIYYWLSGQSITWTFLQDFSNGIGYLWSLDFLSTLTEWIVQFEFTTAWWLNVLKPVQFIFVILFYILGKILIGYGIYQTISAFRKYGR